MAMKISKISKALILLIAGLLMPCVGTAASMTKFAK